MALDPPNSLFATNPGNRGRGRPKGSRSKLATRFFEDVYSAWEEQGSSVIARAFFHDPVASMNMVARLMPQKIEHSVPTDGLSDERLGEMLDFAERMAELKAGQAITIQARVLTDENRPLDLSPEEGGGGPLSVNGCQGEKTPHTLHPKSAEMTEPGHNELVPNKLKATPAHPKGFSATMPHGEQAPTRRPPIGNPKAVVEKPVPPPPPPEYEDRAPVGKPDPVDPESLF